MEFRFFSYFMMLKNSAVCGLFHRPSKRTNVMISGGITNDGFIKSNVYSCGVFSLRIIAISVCGIQCGMWVHSRWSTGVNSVTPMSS